MAPGNEMISRNIIFKVHCQTLELETWIELLSLYELTKKMTEDCLPGRNGKPTIANDSRAFELYGKGCLKTI